MNGPKQLNIFRLQNGKDPNGHRAVSSYATSLHESTSENLQIMILYKSIFLFNVEKREKCHLYFKFTQSLTFILIFYLGFCWSPWVDSGSRHYSRLTATALKSV